MNDAFRLRVAFFRTSRGREPVRAWLKALPRDDRRLIGHDLKTVQFGWPLGMPLIRKLEPDLWEVRTRLKERIARVLFTVADDQMVILHGFVKKSPKTPAADLRLARQRLATLRG